MFTLFFFGSCWMYVELLDAIGGLWSSGAHGFALHGFFSGGLILGHNSGRLSTLCSWAIICLHSTRRSFTPLPHCLKRNIFLWKNFQIFEQSRIYFEHFDHSETSHLTGQSSTLQYCRSTGGGWGHMLLGTTIVFSPPLVTSCMHWTLKIFHFISNSNLYSIRLKLLPLAL